GRPSCSVGRCRSAAARRVAYAASEQASEASIRADGYAFRRAVLCPGPPSSRGPGHRPFTPATRVRIPLGVLAPAATENPWRPGETEVRDGSQRKWCRAARTSGRVVQVEASRRSAETRKAL